MDTQKPPSARPKNSSKKIWEDEILREVYANRDAYSAAHGHDLDRIYADLKRRRRKTVRPNRAA